MVKLNYNAYMVGWVCALPCEVNASRAVLDEVHESLPSAVMDNNSYILGQMNEHNVVIGFPGLGMYGVQNASTVATHMIRTFHNIRFGLMVGVGGGVPRTSCAQSPWNDLRLGDIVISNPRGSHGGVVHYDMGKWKNEGVFHINSHLNKPPVVLLKAAERLRLDHCWEAGQLGNYIDDALQKFAKLPRLGDFRFPGWECDHLFAADYEHQGGEDCNHCDTNHLVRRMQRPSREPVAHYGLIASGNAVMRSALRRDELRDEWEILCFEMEAAGLMDHFPCIVIRGICDYSDGHKNKVWQPYASITAAAYAKDLLRVIHPENVTETEKVIEGLKECELVYMRSLLWIFSSAILTERKVTHTLDRVDREVYHLATSMEEHRKTEILNWLHPYDFGAEQSDIFGQARKGTGHWLLSSTSFQEWLHNENKTLLCQGIPGAGKTVIASIIINNLISRYQSDAGVSVMYIFCNFRRWHEQTATGMLTLLLKQVARQHIGLPASVERLYAQFLSRSIRPSSAEIICALRDVLSTSSRGFIVIDALDEFLGSPQEGLRFLAEIFELQKQTRVNVLATSRPIGEVEEEFLRQESILLEIRAKDEDVHRYLNDHMSLLPSFVLQDADLINEVKRKILDAVDGMFLLAKLHLDSLRDKMTVSSLKVALDSLPTGSDAVDMAYSDAMQRVKSQSKTSTDLAMKALSWIVYAMRPLRTAELEHALSVTQDQEELDQEDIIAAEYIISACAGLVTVDKSSQIIRLVHYTVQEWFERTAATWFPDTHGEIARTCMNYLSLNILGSNFNANDEASQARLRQYALLDYAAENWGHHARKHSLGDSLTAPMFDNESLLVTSAQALSILQKIPASVVEPDLLRKKPRNMGMTKLHLAAYFGMITKVSELLEQGHECNIGDFWGRTPLSWAAYGGHADVVKNLLESGADPEQLDYWGTVPLTCAADRGHEDVVLAFLSRISDPCQRTFAYGHILSSVIRTGNTSLCNLVPSIAALRSYRNYHAQSLLSEAAYHRNKLFVESLLAEGFDADTRDYWENHFYTWWSRKGATPLMWAALTGQESTMQLLLQRGADPRTTDDSGRNVLSYAAEGGFGMIVRWFVDMGHTPLLHGCGGRTALAWAARNGHNSTIRLLIELGVDKVGYDNHDRTATARAAEGGHTSSVKLLIDLGLDPRSLNLSGWKALTWAVDASNEALVRVLLENGDDPNSRDKDSRVILLEWSHLQFAARQGNVGVMKALLDHGAGPLDGRDWEWGRSPISQAAEYGCPHMVKFLIERGVDPDSKDINGDQPYQHNELKTPIMWASINGHEEVVEILLRYGANPNAKDLRGRNPVVYAAENDRVGVTRLLLAHGANFDNRDAYNGRTPLSLASQYGYTAVVGLLLQQGADPNSKDDDGKSPLAWASENGHEDTVVKLAEGWVQSQRV